MPHFNIGDRVIELRRTCYNDKPIEVIDVIYKSKRCLLKYHTVFNRLGDNMVYWVHEDDIALDMKYYRDRMDNKINDILG